MMRVKRLLCICLSFFRKKYYIKPARDYPEEIKRNTIYIVGTIVNPQYAVFQCPCKCGRIVELNLNPDSSPCWTINWSPFGTISISPSIWRKQGCESHFFIKRSSVIWCNTEQKKVEL